MADKALLSFVIILLHLRTDANIIAFEKHQRITSRMACGFRVRLGFGLHSGWGIEGPIGSNYKVDASYLGEHVNMSMRLEGATKEYDVPLLLSQDFYESLSPYMQQFCRKVDRVTVSDPAHSFLLYTIDIHPSPLERASQPLF